MNKGTWQRQKNAFSVIEMLIVIAIFAILVYVFAGPSIRWYHEYKLFSEGQRLHYMVIEAKTYSVSHTVYTSVCLSGNSIVIYNLGIQPTSLCTGKAVEAYTLPSYNASSLSYQQTQVISYNPRGVSYQEGSICVYDSTVNQYYMVCATYAGIRDISGTGTCPSNC